MYITEALNHNINGNQNNIPNQEVIEKSNNSFFEQMIAAGSMQQTTNISNHESAMNKVIQKQDIDSKADMIATNDEENKEGKTTQYLGSTVSTTDMLSTIASFQRG